MGRRGGFLVPFGRIANRLYVIPADVWIMHSNSLPKRTVKKGGEKSNLTVGFPGQAIRSARTVTGHVNSMHPCCYVMKWHFLPQSHNSGLIARMIPHKFWQWGTRRDVWPAHLETVI